MNSILHATNGNLTPRDVAIANVKATLRHFAAEAQTPWLRSVASDALASLAVVEAAPPADQRPLLEILAERGMLDPGPDDFEIGDGFPTPIDVLEREYATLPSISGGGPFVPSDQDWQDFADATDDRDWYREIDAQAAGLAV